MASPGYQYPRSPNGLCSLPVNVQCHSFDSSRNQVSHNDYSDVSDRSFCDMTETFDDSYDGDCGVLDVKLVRKIVSQVEFYLSDENLSQDAFLLKHVQKNKMGYVSIKLLTSFKKIKSLTRDWRKTLYALQFSDKLEVNEEETKVRRKNPVPNSLLGLPPTKLLLAWNLDSVDKKSLLEPPKNFLETVTSLFASYGVLTSVRILKPGKEVPSDVKKYLARYPELVTKTCALVEYENMEGARRALEVFGIKQSTTNDGNTTKVVPVSGRGTRKKSGTESEEIENYDLPDKLSKHKRPVKTHYTVEEVSCCSSSESDSTPASPVLMPHFLPSVNFLNPDISFKPSSFSSPRSTPLLVRKCISQPYHSLSPLATNHGSRVNFSPGSSPEIYRRIPEHSSDSGIYSTSPWVQRRKAAAHNLHTENKALPFSPLAFKKAPVTLGLPNGILRLPYGPDGSKGFHNSIGRGKLVLRH